MADPRERLTLVRSEPPDILHFGKYEVLSKIGTGGMAEIFKCRLSGIGGFDKVVVVKRMLPDLIYDQELVRMFLDEARIVANLSHPNIVQIFEINQEKGNPYIVMEYVRGPTLARVINESWKQGKPCDCIAAKVLSEVASALSHAHEARDPHGQPLNIVHRDVTPHNVVVSTEGVAKLLDFGVAKSSGRLSKTEAGNIKGKFRYMAPEQVRAGETVDGRADVFAVGASLYLAATGVHAYPGRSDMDVLRAAAAGAYKAPSQVRPGIDPELERLILWAMAPRLEVRCPNAATLHEVLDAYVSQGDDRVTNLHVARFLAQLFGDSQQQRRHRWRVQRRGDEFEGLRGPRRGLGSHPRGEPVGLEALVGARLGGRFSRTWASVRSTRPPQPGRPLCRRAPSRCPPRGARRTRGARHSPWGPSPCSPWAWSQCSSPGVSRPASRRRRRPRRCRGSP